MGLQRDRYTVYVSDTEGNIRELVATVNHQDLLRGEQAMLQTPGASDKQYLGMVTAWCWASLMRQGDYAGAYQSFRDQDCQGVDKLDKVDVDPTGGETPATSLSSSQPSSEDTQPGG